LGKGGQRDWIKNVVKMKMEMEMMKRRAKVGKVEERR
jgi:hypothetical protein